MWESIVETLQPNCIQKISIFSNTKQISYLEVMELWQDNDSFRSFFTQLLASAPFSAYFWETPLITKSTINRSFEFVLIDSPQLARVTPDLSSFSYYFKSASQGEEVVAFPNLGNDALLIAPCPIAKMSIYPHLASFIRDAPTSQTHALWQSVGKCLQERLSDRPTWVSTSGLGVYWLHIRLDSYPKYYNFNPYK